MPWLARQSMARFFTYGILIFWSLISLFPLYWLAITSIKSESDITDGPKYLPFIDFSPSLRAWKFLFSYESEKFLLRFLNSTLIASFATLLTLALAVLLLYGLRRNSGAASNTKLSNSMITFTLVTRLLPPVIVVLPLYILAKFFHILDSHVLLILIYVAVNVPVAVWLLRHVIGPNATEQEDSARLEGASHFLVLREILLPMISPTLLAVGILVFALCWNEFVFAVYLVGDTAMTLPPWLVGQLSIKEAQIGSEAEEWANLSAAAVVMAVPLLLGTFCLNRILKWRHDESDQPE
jgi:multiple sugar transport system permease protein